MHRRNRTFLLVGLAVTLLVAAVVSGFASGEPDGLEKVAIDQEFEGVAADHTLGGFVLADYGVEGIENERLATGIAGVIGVAITLVLTLGILYGVRRLRRAGPGEG
jgi:cobalt/nickel transport system permease protein